MTLEEAITLINNGNINHETKSIWADLGCGSGLFTCALASLLEPKSVIYAIDKDIGAFKEIFSGSEVIINPVELNFEKTILPFQDLDGIMMANSLHFVKDKKSFLDKIKSYLNKNGCFLIVEYDTEVSNHWVPYPISFSSLRKLFNDGAYSSVSKISETPSAFRRANLYSAMVNV